MIASQPDLIREVGGGMCHTRRSTKFTTGNHHHILIQSAFMQIQNQRGQRLIHLGQSLALSVIQMKGARVIIPAEVFGCIVGSCGIHVDHRHTCFGQTPCQQTALPPAVRPVTFSQLRIFTTQIECTGNGGTGQNRERRFLKLIHAPGCLFVHATKLIKLLQQTASFVKPPIVDAGGQSQVAGSIVWFRRVARIEGRMTDSQVTGTCHKRRSLNAHVVG